jgi:hypothetical protein
MKKGEGGGGRGGEARGNGHWFYKLKIEIHDTLTTIFIHGVSWEKR